MCLQKINTLIFRYKYFVFLISYQIYYKMLHQQDKDSVCEVFLFPLENKVKKILQFYFSISVYLHFFTLQEKTHFYILEKKTCQKVNK